MNNKIITHAMVLTAGLGLRMKPLSDTTPKPMLRAGGKPMIDWTLDSLRDGGIKHCVVNLHWLGEQIKDHLKNIPSPAISFVNEDPVLETGGGIFNALDKNMLGDGAFYAINADQIWIDSNSFDNDIPALKHLAQVWDETKMDGLLLLQPVLNAFGYDGVGDFNLCADGIVERRHEGATGELVFMGVQILSPAMFKQNHGFKPGDAFSLNQLYERAIKQGRLYGIVHHGQWLHIGTPKALDDANEFLENLESGEK